MVVHIWLWIEVEPLTGVWHMCSSSREPGRDWADRRGPQPGAGCLHRESLQDGR